jgi:hypothetical protein
MNAPQKTERGQVLILIVFGIIGLVGLTALTIDGGNAYLDRRRAQNAADTAAMAAGLARIRQPSGNGWKDAGYERATSNGYQQNANGSTVTIYACTEAGADCELPSGADPNEYVKVVITSVKGTWFGPVVGIKQVENRVEAIAKSKQSIPQSLYNGQAIVALQEGCSPGTPMFISGNFTLNVYQSGIFVNSNCSSAYSQGGSSEVFSEAGICVVGGESHKGGSTAPNHNCSQVDSAKYVLPNPVCTTDGTLTDKGSYSEASPGNYDDVFPGDKGTVRLQKGIYCLNAGFRMNAHAVLTSDLNGNGVHDSATEGVLFYMPEGGIKFNGQATQYLHAISCQECGLSPELVNILFYLPPTNHSEIHMNGGSETQYWGTLLAPSAQVVLNGGSAGGSLHMQMIALNFKNNGNGTLNITYNGDENAKAAPNPELLLFK